MSAEQVLKVPEEELLRSLDDDYVHKLEDTRDLVKSHFDASSGNAVVEISQVWFCAFFPSIFGVLRASQISVKMR